MPVEGDDLVPAAHDNATSPVSGHDGGARLASEGSLDGTPSRPDGARAPRLIRVGSGGPVLELVVGGSWVLADGLTDPASVKEALAVGAAAGKIETLAVRSEGLEQADSALMVYLTAVHDLALAAGVRFDMSGLGPAIAALVTLARAVPERTGTGHEGGAVPPVDQVGWKALAVLREADSQIRFFGELCLSFGRLIRGRARFRWRDVLEILEDAGPRSLLIVTVIAGLIGMILAFIGAVQLRRFGPESMWPIWSVWP